MELLMSKQVDERITLTDHDGLKNCPFCGGECSHGTIRYSSQTVREQHWGQDEFHYVNCIRCQANNKGVVGYRTSELAANAWNQRTEQEVD